MTGFTWEVPTRIHFGTGIYRQALSEEKAMLAGKCVLLVTTGHTLLDNGTAADVESALRQNGCENVVSYVGHGANPEIKEAEEAGQLAKTKGVDLVLGLGGGSAMDLAKAAAVAAVSPHSLREHLTSGIPAPPETLPIIAMPATAGTGSELSKGAIMSDGEMGVKGGIRGRYLTPCVAIVDARFTWSMPAKLTMETGFDAFAHAAESYLSLKANPLSMGLSLQAIRLIGANLSRLLRNIDDDAARENMSYASLTMGMNLYNVGNCLPHRLQYPIGAATHTSHAAGLAALYPAWIKAEYRVCPEKVRDIFQALGLAVPDSAETAAQGFQRWLHTLGIDYTLQSLGVQEQDLTALAEAVTGNLLSDSLGSEAGAAKRLYQAAWRYGSQLILNNPLISA